MKILNYGGQCNDSLRDLVDKMNDNFRELQTSPTINSLSLGAGTLTTPALKFSSGLLLTNPISGAMEYNNTFFLTQSDTVRRSIVLATNATKTTAGAPYTNDGYVTIRIGSTDVRVMTTA